MHDLPHSGADTLCLTEVCPSCHSLYSYRRDASGTLVRELCKRCHPPESAFSPMGAAAVQVCTFCNKPTTRSSGICHNCMTQLKPPPATPPFIGFTGLAQAGKTTCANHLKTTRGFGVLSFAAPLKRMLRALIGDEPKDATPYVLCGQTVRHAMQTLGTEWGRELIGADIWIRAAQAEAERLFLAGFRGLAADDVRFSNEAELIKQMGGTIISILRPGLKPMAHISEAGIDPALVDHRIVAETTEELIEQLEGVMAKA